MSLATTTTMTPEQWGETFSAAPDLSSHADAGLDGALLCRWTGTSPRMSQPILDHHYLVLHLGGAKRVDRRTGASSKSFDVAAGSVSVVPAGMICDWTTRGPIGFAHLYLHPGFIDRVVHEEFDRDPGSIELITCVGKSLPLVSSHLATLLECIQRPQFGSRLLVKSLLNSLTIDLLSKCSTLPTSHRMAPCGIAPARLRRVLDFVEANLPADIGLEELASVAGCSRYHFCRGFHAATGWSPYRYIVRRRLDAAKTLLRRDELTLAQVAKQCGFHSRKQLAVMFVRRFGATPSRFRLVH